MEFDLSKITAIIPSYKPDETLISTFDGLVDAGFTDICVVDDGGGEEYSHIFAELRLRNECTLLTHDKNRGKGAALKTAFEYLVENRAELIGVITVDGDGQHLPCDVLECVKKMCESDSAVLGCRDFSAPNVPKRSKFGNRITSFVFLAFCGMKISDTQTGLRAFPARFQPSLCKIGGDRYEYETNMLLEASAIRMPFCEVTIHTVYLNDNSASHFDAIRDSIRIYKLILKHTAGKMLGLICGIITFALIYALTGEMFGKLTIAAAAVAEISVYWLVKTIVGALALGKVPEKITYRGLLVSVLKLAASILVTYLLCALFNAAGTVSVTALEVISDIAVFFAALPLVRRLLF